MTQGNLDRLKESCDFPVGIQTRLPEDDKTIISTRLGELTFYEGSFHAGLRLSIHPTIRRIVYFYNICPALLAPNAWQSVICAVVVWQYYKFALSTNEFRCLFSLFKNSKPYSGWLYFKVRPGETVVGGYPSNVKGWKRKFFFISGDD